MIDFESVENSAASQLSSNRMTVYRFDVFKGVKSEDGKIIKVKSVGSAFVREGLQTYTLHLKVLLKDTFYLLPNTRPNSIGDYVILTREPSQKLGKKYFWNNVGAGYILDGPNSGVMRLTWDAFIGNDIYMSVEPVGASEVPDSFPSSSQKTAA